MKSSTSELSLTHVCTRARTLSCDHTDALWHEILLEHFLRHYITFDCIMYHHLIFIILLRPAAMHAQCYTEKNTQKIIVIYDFRQNSVKIWREKDIRQEV